MRLDKLVAERFALSRSAAQEAIRQGRVDLGGETCPEPGREVGEKERVEYLPSRPKARKVAGHIRVLFEDRHLLIVDKPAGLLTLPTADHEAGTLIEKAGRYLSAKHGDRRPYIGIVHRLDKETSGALVLARSIDALRALQDLFRVHDVERRYLALVAGMPREDSGTIDRALVADRGDQRRGIARGDEEGRHAVTHWQVVERFGPAATLLACWLETGRTHQIRIHLSAMGHPVIGDKVYGPKPRLKGGSNTRPTVRFGRQALHAQTLGFRHPFTGESVLVEAPPPVDLVALFARLRGG